MISKWGVKNFKSILEANLDLAPLTIFTGVNSSGKSSFLQSIVMMAQAASDKGDLFDHDNFEKIYHNKASGDEIGIDLTIPTEKYEDVYLKLGFDKDSGQVSHGLLELKEEERFIKYNKFYGIYHDDDNYKAEFDASSFKEIEQEIINDDRIAKNIINPLKPKVTRGMRFLPGDISYGPYFEDIVDFVELLIDIPANKLTFQEAETYEYEKLSKLTAAYAYENELSELISSKKDIVDTLLAYSTNNLMWYWPDQDGKNRTVIIPVLFNRIPDFEELFLPYKKHHDADNDEYYDIDLRKWYYVLSRQDEDKKAIIRDILKNGTYKSDLNDLIFEKQGINLGELDYHCEYTLDLPEKLRDAQAHLDNYFKFKIKYLGPLRLDPINKCSDKEEPQKMEKEHPLGFRRRKAEYEQMMMDVGVKGENTMPAINYLHDNQYEIKNYYSPKLFDDHDYKLEKNKNFSEALNEWLQYFNIADKFKKRKMDDKQVAVNLVIDELEYSLTQLGTGVSQILPILVMCLTADENSTLIIQEPEQSLHPKLQSKLADFFIATALSNRQCLIETHSEYIIEKLQYRIVNEESENIKKNTKIYSTEKKNGKSEYEEIEINEFGAIINWPDNFFDENLKIADDINKAVLKKWEKNNKGQ